mmetsp:Transcript_33158/g.84702  ORF Transcript_33158/g.84702 Transcript_33158/m.84702 type:complete len:502 (-) Transcript_33158:231-1736(-)
MDAQAHAANAASQGTEPAGDSRLELRAAKATARLAAVDTWKSWARRKDGPDGFQWTDIFSGIRAQASHGLRQRHNDDRTPGKTCPTCYEERPEPNAVGKRWHRLYCGCTVCTSCVGRWNATLLQDAAGSAAAMPPLKCPACSAALRSSDAALFFEGSPDVGIQYEELTRDATLRMMPEWRSCPRCKGGGFVTPECLAPRYRETGRAAGIEADKHFGVLVMWLVLAGIAAALVSPLWIIVGAAPVAVVSKKIGRKARQAVAAIQNEALGVGCPHCGDDFLLPNYVQALTDIHAEDETRQWMAANTRPCPSCGSPIQKASGCNYMRCLHCRVHFCWACMRPGQRCGHFGCRNGAPFGNARMHDLIEATPRRRDARVPREPQDAEATLDKIRRVVTAARTAAGVLALAAAAWCVTCTVGVDEPDTPRRASFWLSDDAGDRFRDLCSPYTIQADIGWAITVSPLLPLLLLLLLPLRLQLLLLLLPLLPLLLLLLLPLLLLLLLWR